MLVKCTIEFRDQFEGLFDGPDVLDVITEAVERLMPQESKVSEDAAPLSHIKSWQLANLYEVYAGIRLQWLLWRVSRSAWHRFTTDRHRSRKWQRQNLSVPPP